MKEFFLRRYQKMKLDFDVEQSEVKPALRINTLKIKPAELIRRLHKEKIKVTRIPFLKYGYWYEAPFSLGSTPEYLQGYYYLQEAASQVSAEYLDPQKNETVLDMAAAPGSKTTYLAQLMENTGTIIALDIADWRLNALRNNCERMGVTNVLLYNKDARYAEDLNIEFDKVLLDAPCSGNFCIEEDWFNKRTLEDIQQNSRKQKELLRTAFSVLKKGGRLVYSTCSLEPEEDEEVVNWGRAELEGFIVKKEERFWPQDKQTQGFYISVIEKK
jgi:NOL1/NOP2/sun family putative RNA methylase